MIKHRIVTDIPAFVAGPAKGRPEEPWDEVHHDIDNLLQGETLLIPFSGVFNSEVVSAVGLVARHTGKKFFTRKIDYQGVRHYAVQWRPN